jgi:hypothetical protein
LQLPATATTQSLGRAVSQENVEIVRSVFEPLDGINLAAIDWGVDEIREMLLVARRSSALSS